MFPQVLLITDYAVSYSAFTIMYNFNSADLQSEINYIY